MALKYGKTGFVMACDSCGKPVDDNAILSFVPNEHGMADAFIACSPECDVKYRGGKKTSWNRMYEVKNCILGNIKEC